MIYITISSIILATLDIKWEFNIKTEIFWDVISDLFIVNYSNYDRNYRYRDEFIEGFVINKKTKYFSIEML